MRRDDRFRAPILPLLSRLRHRRVVEQPAKIARQNAGRSGI